MASGAPRKVRLVHRRWPVLQSAEGGMPGPRGRIQELLRLPGRETQGEKVGFPTWRKRRHGSRFRYDADRARPVSARVVALPGVGKVRTLEDMAWLTGRIADGRARVIGATVKETAGRWWVSFQLEIDRSDINEHRLVASDAAACGIDVGVKTFATIVDDDGTVTEIHAPKPLKDALRKLRKANKALACQGDLRPRVRRVLPPARLQVRMVRLQCVGGRSLVPVLETVRRVRRDQHGPGSCRPHMGMRLRSRARPGRQRRPEPARGDGPRAASRVGTRRRAVPRRRKTPVEAT